MERSKGTQTAVKKVITAMFLAAALASTGCSQNALLNPTADQIQAAGSGSASQSGHTMQPSGGTMHP